jgi:hypothetical protein
MRRILPFLMMLAALPAWGQDVSGPFVGPGVTGRNQINTMPGFRTPGEFGAAGDAIRAWGLTFSTAASASPTVSMMGTYQIQSATVVCNTATSAVTVTLPGGATLPSFLANSGTWRVYISNCGAASGTTNNQLTSVTGTGPYTFNLDAVAGTTFSGTSRIVIGPTGSTAGVTTTTNANSGTYHQWRIDACTISGTTLTCPNGPFMTVRDFTQSGPEGLLSTYINIQDPVGVCPDFRTRILTTASATAATLESAPSCQNYGANLALWWGPLLFPTTIATGPTISGTPWTCEFADTGTASAPQALAASAYVDPFHATFSGTTVTSRVAVRTTLTCGTPDDTALDNTATAALNAGYDSLYLPPGKNYLKTSTTSAASSLGGVILCSDGMPSGRIFYPLSTPSLKNAVRCTPAQPISVPQTSINWDAHMRSAQFASGTVKVVVFGDSMISNGSNGMGEAGSGSYNFGQWLSRALNKPVQVYPYAIGGTLLANLAPNFPVNVSANGIGIPTAAQVSTALWYTNGTQKWIDYGKAVCPHIVMLGFQNDGYNLPWSAYWDVLTYMNGAAWQSSCGFTPSIIWITTGMFSLTQSNAGTHESGFYSQDFYRSSIMAGDYPTMANGGQVGLLDLHNEYVKATVGVDHVYAPPMVRAMYSTPPTLANGGPQNSFPYTWPRPVRNYSFLSQLRVSAPTNQTSSTWWNTTMGGSINMPLGNGAAGTPNLINGQSSPAAIGYPGGQISLTRDAGGNIAYTGYTFRFSQTATCTVVTVTLTCTTAVANAGHYYADIIVQGAGAATCPVEVGGANCLITTIAPAGVSADGKTITMVGSGTLGSSSTTVIIQHKFVNTTISTISGLINNGGDGAPACTTCGLQNGISMTLKGPFASIGDSQVSNVPIFQGPVVRFGGRFKPIITIGLAGTTTPASQFSFPQMQNSQPNSADDGDDFTPFTPTYTDYKCWGQPPGYVGPEGGGSNAHIAIGCMSTLIQTLVSGQNGSAFKTVPGSTVMNITANAQITTIPAGATLVGIDIINTTANAVTGGINIGTAAAGSDVVLAFAVGASANVAPTDAQILKRTFANTAQGIFISAVTAWNSANLTVRVRWAQ